MPRSIHYLHGQLEAFWLHIEKTSLWEYKGADSKHVRYEIRNDDYSVLEFVWLEGRSPLNGFSPAESPPHQRIQMAESWGLNERQRCRKSMVLLLLTCR